MALYKCEKYELKVWSEGDFSPDGIAVASYSLFYSDTQVGAVSGADNIIDDIRTKPPKEGHGTKFLELLMKRARALGYDSFKVNMVIGHGETLEEQRKLLKP